MRSNTINTTLPSGEDTNYNILYDILKLKQMSSDYTEAHTHWLGDGWSGWAVTEAVDTTLWVILYKQTRWHAAIVVACDIQRSVQ